MRDNLQPIFGWPDLVRFSWGPAKEVLDKEPEKHGACPVSWPDDEAEAAARPSPRLASPRLASPPLASPRLASPPLASPRLPSPRLPSPPCPLSHRPLCLPLHPAKRQKGPDRHRMLHEARLEPIDAW